MRQIGLRKSVDYESMNGFHVSRIGLVLCAAVVLFAGVVLSWLKDCLRIKSGKDWRFLYKLVCIFPNGGILILEIKTKSQRLYQGLAG